MAAMGLADSVPLFSASDFGRTFSSNGSGTDHAWGNHHFAARRQRPAGCSTAGQT